MAQSICILIGRPPHASLWAGEGLRLANGSLAYGLVAMVGLLGEAVWVAKQGQETEGTPWPSLLEAIATLQRMGEASSGRLRILVDERALEERGLAPSDLVPGLEILPGAELIRIASGHDVVVHF